jgi:small-conductance mechanosensitive channel
MSMMRALACLLLLAVTIPGAIAQQPGTEPLAPGTVSPVPRDQFAPLWFSNRLIVTFRAAVVSRDPVDRAQSARQLLSRLVDDGVTGPVGSRTLLGATVVSVGGHDAFAIVAADVDPGTGDLTALTNETIGRLQIAMAEAVEARTPRRLAWAAARSLLATALMAMALAGLARGRRWTTRRLRTAAEARLKQWRVGADPALLRASRLVEVTRGTVTIVARGIGLVVVYTWLIYVLDQFPLTRPWGETLGGFLVSTVTRLGLGALAALPGLFTAALIFLVARFVVRLATLVFQGIEDGRVDMPAIAGAKAAPTRRIVTTAVWLFAAVIAYPYLPGSSTDAFKGASVFIGLVVSLGSSGIVNQMMSGFVLTYTGALAPGDYAAIGEIEGTVSHIGALSTKIRTRRNEEVTIPNAVVVAGGTVNYSRHRTAGVLATTTVTIGYDVPWRQVEAMLLAAVARAPGVQVDPPPSVLQTSLSDYYIEYTLQVCPEVPAQRVPLLAAIRAHIVDVFNEYGVQIMSPHYKDDPADAKVVPREHWFEAPASEPSLRRPGAP